MYTTGARMYELPKKSGNPVTSLKSLIVLSENVVTDPVTDPVTGLTEGHMK